MRDIWIIREFEENRKQAAEKAFRNKEIYEKQKSILSGNVGRVNTNPANSNSGTCN